MNKQQTGIAMAVNSGIILTGSIALFTALITISSSHPEIYKPDAPWHVLLIVLTVATMALLLMTILMNSGAIHESMNLGDPESAAYKRIIGFMRVSRWFFALAIVLISAITSLTMAPIT